MTARASTFPSPFRAACRRTRDDGVLRHVEGDDLRGVGRHGEREPALIGEAVEHPAARVAGRRRVVLALVEERPGLLPLPGVDADGHRALAHVDRLGHGAADELHLLLEPLQLPHARVVPRQDAGGRDELLEQADQVGQQPVRPLRERLHDEAVAVPIDDERGQQVRLAVHQPVRGGVDAERRAVGDRALEAPTPQPEVGGLVAARQHAQRDLGSIAEERPADRAAAGPDHGDGVAAAGADLGDVGPVDPRMAAADALGAPAGDDGGGFHGGQLYVQFLAMRVALGADHAGFLLKETIKRALAALAIEVEDMGTDSADSVDYPDFAAPVARGVASGAYDRGILVCGTGIGMAMAANKIAGVRAAPVVDVATARLSREHNDANVLALGGRVTAARARARDRPRLPGHAVRGRPPPAPRRQDRRPRALADPPEPDDEPESTEGPMSTDTARSTRVRSLADTDPEIDRVVANEIHRQNSGLELIASENFVTPAVLEAMGSVLTNKYAEGYPGKRYYGGCEFVDVAEQLAIDRAKQLFGADHANVQPHSGAQANMAVYFALLKPGDTVLGMNLAHGGHLTHGHPLNFSGKLYTIVPYGVRQDDERIDYDELERLAREHKPKLIVVGASAYPRVIDFARIAAVAREVGAAMVTDMAHIAGLVAAGVHPSPVPHSDFVTTTTHKTLRGPRGGLILSRAERAKDLDRAVFPGVQGGPLMHVIAAKAVCFKEAMEPGFAAYQRQVVANAARLARASPTPASASSAAAPTTT